MKHDLLLGYVACPNLDVARKIARHVVEQGLVACVNLIRGIESYYHWNGEMCEDQEVILLAKMVKEHWKAFAEAVAKLHPYECPAILALPVDQCIDSFAQWVSEHSAAVPYHGSPRKTH